MSAFSAPFCSRRTTTTTTTRQTTTATSQPQLLGQAATTTLRRRRRRRRQNQTGSLSLSLSLPTATKSRPHPWCRATTCREVGRNRYQTRHGARERRRRNPAAPCCHASGRVDHTRHSVIAHRWVSVLRRVAACLLHSSREKRSRTLPMTLLLLDSRSFFSRVSSFVVLTVAPYFFSLSSQLHICYVTSVTTFTRCGPQ